MDSLISDDLNTLGNSGIVIDPLYGWHFDQGVAPDGQDYVTISYNPLILEVRYSNGTITQYSTLQLGIDYYSV